MHAAAHELTQQRHLACRFVQEFNAEVQQRSSEGVKKFRELCEAALTAAGLHFAEGPRLWAIYRCVQEGLLTPTRQPASSLHAGFQHTVSPSFDHVVD